MLQKQAVNEDVPQRLKGSRCAARKTIPAQALQCQANQWAYGVEQGGIQLVNQLGLRATRGQYWGSGRDTVIWLQAAVALAHNGASF